MLCFCVFSFSDLLFLSICLLVYLFISLSVFSNSFPPLLSLSLYPLFFSSFCLSLLPFFSLFYTFYPFYLFVSPISGYPHDKIICQRNQAKQILYTILDSHRCTFEKIGKNTEIDGNTEIKQLQRITFSILVIGAAMTGAVEDNVNIQSEFIPALTLFQNQNELAGLAEKHVQVVEDSLHKIMCNDVLDGEGYCGLDVERDSKEGVRNALCLFPNVLLRRDEHENLEEEKRMYPIQLLTHGTEDGVLCSNTKSLPFVLIAAQVAIKFNLSQEDQQGGLLIKAI